MRVDRKRSWGPEAPASAISDGHCGHGRYQKRARVQESKHGDSTDAVMPPRLWGIFTTFRRHHYEG